jgi:hypothetical protein
MDFALSISCNRCLSRACASSHALAELFARNIDGVPCRLPGPIARLGDNVPGEEILWRCGGRGRCGSIWIETCRGEVGDEGDMMVL